MTVTHKRKTKRSTSAAPASTLAGDLAVAAAETDGGMKYHCDLCLADITDILRIRCAAVECTDFDVCVECFAAGKEGANHRHDHPYRILDKFAYPIVCAGMSGECARALLFNSRFRSASFQNGAAMRKCA